MKFKEFYSNFNNMKSVSNKRTEEQLFEDVTGVSLPSMKSFMAWLILHEHIPAFLKRKSGKPISVIKIPESQKILFLTKKLPNLRELAEQFSKKFEQKEYLQE